METFKVATTTPANLLTTITLEIITRISEVVEGDIILKIGKAIKTTKMIDMTRIREDAQTGEASMGITTIMHPGTTISLSSIRGPKATITTKATET
jgi:hypothetical protein